MVVRSSAEGGSVGSDDEEVDRCGFLEESCFGFDLVALSAREDEFEEVEECCDVVWTGALVLAVLELRRPRSILRCRR